MCAVPNVHAPGGDVVLGCVLGDESGLSRGRFKRVRLSRKTTASEAFQGVVGDRPRPCVWKRSKVSDFSLCSDEEMHLHEHLPVEAPVQDRLGVGRIPLELRRPTPPGLHCLQLAAARR